MLNFRIARQYAIPYLDRVTMPEKWANWLAKRGDGNPRLLAEPAVGGLKTWDHGKHGPAPWMEFFYDWRFADLFNTGTLDLLLTCGAIRQIAYRADGTEAWRYDDPAAGFMDIRMDSNFPVLDIDGDGRIEAILPRKVGSVLHLCIVDATTGALKLSTPFPEMREYPADLRCGILAVNARGRPRPSDILVGWDYHELFLFDETLNLLWRRRLGGRQPGRHKRVRIMGHTPLAWDVDGDGLDEIVAGSTLLTPEGEISWIAPDLPCIIQDGHVDCPIAVDWNGKGKGHESLFISTGGYCFEHDGLGRSGWRLAWGLGKTRRLSARTHRDMVHGQAARVASLLPGVPGRQVVLYDNVNRVFPEKPDKVIAIAAGGRVIWEREFFQPGMQEGGFGFWCGDWDGDGLDEVFVNDKERVNILEGETGETIGQLPGHLVYVLDILGDSRAEAITVDGIMPGMHLNVLENADPPLQGEAPLTRRVAGPAYYNLTRY